MWLKPPQWGRPCENVSFSVNLYLFSLWWAAFPVSVQENGWKMVHSKVPPRFGLHLSFMISQISRSLSFILWLDADLHLWFKRPSINRTIKTLKFRFQHCTILVPAQSLSFRSDAIIQAWQSKGGFAEGPPSQLWVKQGGQECLRVSLLKKINLPYLVRTS